MYAIEIYFKDILTHSFFNKHNEILYMMQVLKTMVRIKNGIDMTNPQFTGLHKYFRYITGYALLK